MAEGVADEVTGTRVEELLQVLSIIIPRTYESISRVKYLTEGLTDT